MLNGKTQKARPESQFCDIQALVMRFYYASGGVLLWVLYASVSQERLYGVAIQPLS